MVNQCSKLKFKWAVSTFKFPLSTIKAVMSPTHGYCWAIDFIWEIHSQVSLQLMSHTRSVQFVNGTNTTILDSSFNMMLHSRDLGFRLSNQLPFMNGLVICLRRDNVFIKKMVSLFYIFCYSLLVWVTK